jgi:hypothetical protein
LSENCCILSSVIISEGDQLTALNAVAAIS